MRAVTTDSVLAHYNDCTLAHSDLYMGQVTTHVESQTQFQLLVNIRRKLVLFIFFNLKNMKERIMVEREFSPHNYSFTLVEGCI